MFFLFPEDLEDLRENHHEESDHQLRHLAVEELCAARREHRDAICLQSFGKGDHILVLHRMEEERNLIEVGDDLLLL